MKRETKTEVGLYRLESDVGNNWCPPYVSVYVVCQTDLIEKIAENVTVMNEVQLSRVIESGKEPYTQKPEIHKLASMEVHASEKENFDPTVFYDHYPFRQYHKELPGLVAVPLEGDLESVLDEAVTTIAGPSLI